MKTFGSIVLVAGILSGNAQANDPAPQAPAQNSPPTSTSAKFEATCPEEVRTKQAPSSPVKGWSSFVEVLNSRQIFTGATLAEGHPKDGVILDAKPSPAESTSNETFFDLPKGKDVFLVCQYGNTLVRLIQKLPKGLTMCRIGYSETLGHVQKALCE